MEKLKVTALAICVFSASVKNLTFFKKVDFGNLTVNSGMVAAVWPRFIAGCRLWSAFADSSMASSQQGLMRRFGRVFATG